MTEMELCDQLTQALIRSGVDKALMRFDYAIGRHFIADCVVLSGDGRTPAICFEVKPRKTSVTLEHQYQMLSQIYRKELGVDICYLVCLAEIDGVVVPVIRIHQDVIRLDSDATTLQRFLNKANADIAIAKANHANDFAMRNFKVIARRVAIVSLFMFVTLDVSMTFLLTTEHLIFVLVIMGLFVVPYLLDVFIVHPNLLDQIARLLEKSLRK